MYLYYNELIPYTYFQIMNQTFDNQNIIVFIILIFICISKQIMNYKLSIIYNQFDELKKLIDNHINRYNYHYDQLINIKSKYDKKIN